MIVSVDNLSFAYDNVLALQNVSCKLESERVYALVGPNGAGKSTFLRILATLVMPLVGEVKVGGFNTKTEAHECRRLLGFLPDSYGLPPSQTVESLLRWVGMINGFDGETLRVRVNELLDQVNLQGNRHAKIRELSRGMKQRLGIAQSIFTRPKLILMDEPASGLDPESRLELSNLILTLKASGACVVVSSHILSELEDYCDELLIIKDGRLSHEVATTKGDKQLSLRIRTKEIAKLKSFILEKGDGVIIREDFDTLHLLLYEREDAPAKLLQELIVADIPILEFASVTESFQERYQKQMQRINNQKNEE